MKRYLFYLLLMASISGYAQVGKDGEKIMPAFKPGDSTYTKVDVEAIFPGGDAAWRKYLEKNLNAQVASDNFAPPGNYRVIVYFVVDKQGNISDIEPLTDHGYGMEEELVRVMKNTPTMAPAILNGTAVRSFRKQTITFKITTPFELSTYKLKAGEPTTVELIAVTGDSYSVSISSGSLTALGNKKYSVLVDKPGYALFTVWIHEKKKKKELGKIALRVE